MDNININKSTDLPYFPIISFDANSGKCSISGESYMEDTYKFYAPIFDWFKRFVEEIKRPINLEIKLTYFNTSSSRALLDIFDILKRYETEGGKVTVIWYYDPEDPDMKYEVEDFMEESGLEIDLIELD